MTNEVFKKSLEEAFPDEKGELMITFTQEWFEQGEKAGLQQGLQQGLKEGEARSARRFLERKFGQLNDEMKTQINELSLEKIEKFGEEMFDFQSLDDAQVWLNANDEAVS